MQDPPTNSTSSATSSDPAARNVETVARMEQAAQAQHSRADRLIDRITQFVGSVWFLYLHLLWFILWPVVNLMLGSRPFDPYPYFLLVLLLAMEAIILSTMILMTQNRQQRLADRRAHLDLQVNLLAEQETTKILSMLDAIQHHLGIGQHDPEVAALKEATEPEQLVRQIEEQAERLEQDPNSL